jgi:hypothetical protein
MMKATAKNDPLHQTVAVFRKAGFAPKVHHGRKHVKVRYDHHDEMCEELKQVHITMEEYKSI